MEEDVEGLTDLRDCLMTPGLGLTTVDLLYNRIGKTSVLCCALLCCAVLYYTVLHKCCGLWMLKRGRYHMTRKLKPYCISFLNSDCIMLLEFWIVRKALLMSKWVWLWMSIIKIAHALRWKRFTSHQKTFQNFGLCNLCSLSIRNFLYIIKFYCLTVALFAELKF